MSYPISRIKILPTLLISSTLLISHASLAFPGHHPRPPVVRHAYNSAEQTWFIQSASPYISITPCDKSSGYSGCTITPKQILTITYQRKDDGLKHLIKISDYKHTTKVFNVVGHEIKHPNQSNTGAVSLNNPSDGDITIEPFGSDWSAHAK